MTTIEDLPSLGKVKLVGNIDNTTVNPTIKLSPSSALKIQIDEDPANDVLLTSIPLTLSATATDANGELLSERTWLTGGVEGAGDDEGTVSYTATVRGLYNGNTVNPPSSSDGGARNYKSHSNGAICTIDETWLTRNLKSVYNAGSVTRSAEAGELLVKNESVSIHTDGKLYKYHKTNYPSLVGIVNENTDSGSQAVYTTFGGLSIDHSGLTPGNHVFAENTGQIVESSSATTTKLGVADSATSITVVKSSDIEQMTQVEVEAGNSQVAKSISAETVKQGVAAHSGLSLVAREDISERDFVSFYGLSGDFASATSDILVGRVASDEKVAPVIFGNGVSDDHLHIALKKQGSPTDNFTIRIETDSSGAPSGTLAHANATASIAGTSLTTSYADTIVNFAGAFSLSDNVKHWVVIGRSGATNASNYYKVGGLDGVATAYIFSKYNGSWGDANDNIPYLVFGGAYNSGLILNTGPYSNNNTLRSSTFMGIASGSASAGDSVSYKITGSVGGFSNLIVGAHYYIDGQTLTLNTTSSSIPAMFQAVSETELVIINRVA